VLSLGIAGEHHEPNLPMHRKKPIDQVAIANKAMDCANQLI
jgi:hypothetical protein